MPIHYAHPDLYIHRFSYVYVYIYICVCVCVYMHIYILYHIYVIYCIYKKYDESDKKTKYIIWKCILYKIYIYIYIYMYYIINIYIYICIYKIYFHKTTLLIFSKAKYKNSRCGLTKYCKFAWNRNCSV